MSGYGDTITSVTITEQSPSPGLVRLIAPESRANGSDQHGIWQGDHRTQINEYQKRNNGRGTSTSREIGRHHVNNNRAGTVGRVKHRDVCCMMLNAQSIRSKFDEFRCYIALQAPDIICVTETWVSESFCGDRLQDFELQGYNLFSYCRDSRQGGGVFLYVNNLYCTMSVTDSFKAKEVESIWIDVQIGVSKKEELRIGAFYRPGNLLRLPQSEADVKICDEIRRNFRTHCIIMGDFNLRGYEGMAETNECAIFRQLFEEELFLHQFVTEPTRLGSILDLVFSDNRELLHDFVIREGLGKSDHNAVQFRISSNSNPRDNLILVPDFNRANFDEIRTELANIDWKDAFAGLDACEAWNIFQIKLKEIENSHVPFRHKRRRKKERPPWLTPQVKHAIRTKRNAFKKMKESKIESDTSILIYQKCRDQVKRVVRAAKRAKELNLARNCTGDSKKFFSFYKMSSVPKNIGPLKFKETVLNKDKDMVELFNNQFRSVFTVEDESSISLLKPSQLTQETMDDPGPINCDLVRVYLKKIKPNKAEGPDAVYELLESIIKDKMVEFFDENDLIRDSQHGFRKNRSCLTNLLKFLNVATEAFDKGEQLDVTYLDFSKAFDKVPHKRLCMQLKCHGISGKTLDWIELWLSGRQQRVLLNGSKSEWREVLSGVPQGSVLGPLLFFVFVNTIDNGIASEVLKFADDIKVFRTIKGNSDRDLFQSDLDRLVQWSEEWQMKFNHNKCNIMNMGRVYQKNFYELGGQKMEHIGKGKDLGIMVNSKLSASDQVTEARKKALRMLGVINRNVAYKSAEVITKLYCAFVRPHLEYCVQAWCPIYEKDSWLLERVQKRATKMVNGLSSLEYEERLKTLDIFSLKYRRLRGDLIEVFKFINGQHMGYLKDMFELSKDTRGRRHEH